MFGLTFEKLLLIGAIAAFLLGPDRLPHYAAMLGRFVRQLRDMGRVAQDRFKEEMGPEFSDVDWKKLNPRQYDPRHIIREALRDDPDVAPAAPAPAPVATVTPVSPPPVHLPTLTKDEPETEPAASEVWQKPVQPAQPSVVRLAKKNDAVEDLTPEPV